MPRIQSSRRTAPLRDVDYDHEIILIDHETPDAIAVTVSPPAADSPTKPASSSSTNASPADSALQLAPAPAPTPTAAPAAVETRRSIGSALLSVAGPGAALGAGALLPVPSTGSSHTQYVMSVPYETGASVVAGVRTEIRGVSRPSVEGTTRRNSSATTPEIRISSVPSRQPRREAREWVIDVLYENQRGLFLCSAPLFSAKALGNLDPSPWTNTYHKPSLTSPDETQLPDPTWHWVWSEWRINHDPLTACDDDGWEYSFMFSDKFSWHGPTWYSSFVRRRAWTRKRARTLPDNPIPSLVVDTPLVGHGSMVIPGSHEQHSESPNSGSPDRCWGAGRTASKMSSRSASASRRSMTEATRATRADLGMANGLAGIEIYDTPQLLGILRAQRIDREKLDAVDNYLRNALDNLQPLQHAMHEAMALIVFQHSRRHLLGQIAAACELAERQLAEAEADTGAGDCSERDRVRRRLENLQAAKKHAEEEVRRLAYWSDVRVLGDRLGEVEMRGEECMDK